MTSSGRLLRREGGRETGRRAGSSPTSTSQSRAPSVPVLKPHVPRAAAPSKRTHVGAAASALAAWLAAEGTTRWAARGGRPSCTVTVVVLLRVTARWTRPSWLPRSWPVHYGPRKRWAGNGPALPQHVLSVTVDDDDDEEETARAPRKVVHEETTAAASLKRTRQCLHFLFSTSSTRTRRPPLIRSSLADAVSLADRCEAPGKGAASPSQVPAQFLQPAAVFDFDSAF
jgi:hypothetical protein